MGNRATHYSECCLLGLGSAQDFNPLTTLLPANPAHYSCPSCLLLLLAPASVPSGTGRAHPHAELLCYRLASTA